MDGFVDLRTRRRAPRRAPEAAPLHRLPDCQILTLLKGVVERGSGKAFLHNPFEHDNLQRKAVEEGVLSQLDYEPSEEGRTLYELLKLRRFPQKSGIEFTLTSYVFPAFFPLETKVRVIHCPQRAVFNGRIGSVAELALNEVFVRIDPRTEKRGRPRFFYFSPRNLARVDPLG